MSRWSWRKGAWGIGASLLLLTAVVGCGGSKEEPPVGKPSSSPPESQGVTPPSSSGSVIVGRNLGLAVTGSGAGAPDRSLDVLEQQLLSFVPQLQEVYNRELAQDPGVMGSLDVRMTIEPGGTVSDLRFPFKRISSEKLTSAVYDSMRAWTFPPAEAQVDLRYRMVFVPAGVDQASIVKWESLLGDRVVMDQRDEVPSPASAEISGPVITAAPAKNPAPVAEQKEPGGAPSEKIHREGDNRRALSERTSREPAEGNASHFVASWYRVTRPTKLYSAPRESAEVVTQLRPGKHVWVVGVVGGEWLEVHSVKGRVPGFLNRDNATPERSERAGG